MAFAFFGVFLYIGRRKPKIGSIMLIAFLLRLAFALLFPTEPFSDYLKYHETALSLINKEPFPDSSYISAFPHTLSYSLFLSGVYGIFGGNPMWMYIINAFLGTASVWLLYKCSNEKCAFLYAIFPTAIFYTSLLATEIPYTLLLFAALYFAKKEKNLLSGAITAVMNFFRPTGIIFVIAYFIYTFFCKKEKKLKNKALAFGAFFAIYLLVSFSGNTLLCKISGEKLCKAPFGYNLYVGMNEKSLGRWNEEDYKLAMSFSDANEMHEFMAKSALKRFLNNGFFGNLRLMAEKFSLTWGSEALICFYLSQSSLFKSIEPFMKCLAQGFHLYIAFIAFLTAVTRKKEPKFSDLTLPILLILGNTALYLITETMERYIYAPLLMIILIAGETKGNYNMFFKDLMADINAVLERDPASKSRLEVYFLSPGVKALKMHRRANFFWRHGFEFTAKLIAMRARKKTGIEIHPAAKIGKGVMIDHGMGVVIGETAVVGDNCTIYQNVTLGGTGKDTGKRHPTIGNNVMIGSGAKVLGPFCVGDNSKIAANAVVLSEIPPDSTCVGVPARVVRQNNKKVHDCAWQMDQIHISDPVSQELCKIYMRLEKLEKAEERNEKQ